MKLRILTLAVLLVATGLAGCFAQTPGSDEPEFLISRAHTIDVNSEKGNELNDADSPREFIRTLVDTALVVRVATAGDYELAYTDENGQARRETLTGLTPGVPRSVAGADPFAAATLASSDGAVVATRTSLTDDWWQVGEMPVGMRADAPATGVYDARFDARGEVSLSDVRSDDGAFVLESLVARLAMPADGVVSWATRDDGALTRLDVDGEYAIDDSRGGLMFFEMTGSYENESGTLGAELLSGNAAIDGGVSFWLDNGRFSAAQFQGGSVRFAPDLIMWATGFAAEGEEFPCAGASREDQCRPEELESYEESEPAGEREEIPTDEPRAEGEEEREALAILEALLATSLGLHDSLTITLTTDSQDFGGSEESGDFEVRYVHELVVNARENVQVPAGTYDAYRVVQTASVYANIEELKERRCQEWRDESPWDCVEYEEHTYFSGYVLDEVLMRATLWLDAATYQPVKGSVESPLDVGALARGVIREADADFWSEAHLDSFDADNLQLTLSTETSFEARELTGDAKLSPVVGVLLGSVLAGGAGPGMLPTWFLGFGTSSSYAEEVRPVEAPRPMAYMSLTSAGPLHDGVKEYEVEAVAPDTYWSQFMITVDGETRVFSFQGDCDGGLEFEYVACGNGEPESFGDTIDAGDILRLPAVEAGQTLRVIEQRSNTVVLTMLIG